MWRRVGFFLSRFQIKPTETFIKKESLDIIRLFLGHPLNEEEIDFKNGILYFKNNNSSLCNELFIKKKEILKRIEKKLGKNAPKDIMF